MRVAFLGNAPWSVPSLEALTESAHDVAVVATRVPRPAGRGGPLTPTAVAREARRLELPLREVETVRSGEGFDALRDSETDVLVVVAYGEILPAGVLALPRVAPVNVHFSLLPALRGAAPVQRAILEGMAVTGVTTIRMDEGMDTGPILLQREEPIDDDDDAGSLGSRLAAVGGSLLVETLDRLEAGGPEGRNQDEARATFAPKLRPEERIIDWNRSADSIARQVRALAPSPGATTSFRGGRLKVLRARPVEADALEMFGQPGMLSVGKDLLAAGSADVPIRLAEVQPEGRRRMTGAEFVRGYRPEPGERLG
jgi:methionyl-tRNA formyltransferase